MTENPNAAPHPCRSLMIPACWSCCIRSPQETQDKFLVIATNYADRYCEEYDIHLEEFRRIGYLRQLSKQVYCALNTKLYYDKNHDPQEVKDIFEIANYFHSKFTWMLNDNILQRSKGLNAPLEEIPL